MPWNLVLVCVCLCVCVCVCVCVFVCLFVGLFVSILCLHAKCLHLIQFVIGYQFNQSTLFNLLNDLKCHLASVITPWCSTHCSTMFSFITDSLPLFKEGLVILTKSYQTRKPGNHVSTTNHRYGSSIDRHVSLYHWVGFHLCFLDNFASDCSHIRALLLSLLSRRCCWTT